VQAQMPAYVSAARGWRRLRPSPRTPQTVRREAAAPGNGRSTKDWPAPFGAPSPSRAHVGPARYAPPKKAARARSRRGDDDARAGSTLSSPRRRGPMFRSGDPEGALARTTCWRQHIHSNAFHRKTLCHAALMVNSHATMRRRNTKTPLDRHLAGARNMPTQSVTAHHIVVASSPDFAARSPVNPITWKGTP